MPQLSWKALREAPPEPEGLLELCGAKSTPVDIASVATQIGIRITSLPPTELVEIVPWEHQQSRFPAFDELLIDGVAKIDSEKATIFLSNDRKIAPPRRRFTIATLLSHVLYHPPGIYVRLDYWQRLPEEEEALDFASEFLMPRSLLIRTLEEHPNATLEDIATIFNVSTGALRVRIDRLHDPAQEPWLALGLSPDTSLDDAEKAVHEQLKQHRPELFSALPPEYGEQAEATRQDLEYKLARLRLQAVLRLPTGIPHHSRMPTVAEVGTVLKEARKLIATRGWCQKFRARDGYGKKQVRFDRDNAGQFNPVGAIYRAAGEDYAAREIALAVFANAAGVRAHPSEIDRWNDRPDQTRQHIVNVFDEAIATTGGGG